MGHGCLPCPSYSWTPRLYLAGLVKSLSSISWALKVLTARNILFYLLAHLLILQGGGEEIPQVKGSNSQDLPGLRAENRDGVLLGQLCYEVGSPLSPHSGSSP